MNANACRGVTILKVLRDFRGYRARHHPRAEFDHIDLKALGPRGGGEFQPDEARADHDDMPAGGDPLPQRLAVVERPQITHVRQIGIGNVQQPIARAGRQHQMPVIQRRARGEQQPARGAIDRDRAIADQLDVLIAIKLVGPEHQTVRPAFALEIGLGQRRPLIWQMRLVVDQTDALAEAMLAQRCSELKTRMTGADDQNCSLRHGVRPNRRKSRDNGSSSSS